MVKKIALIILVLLFFSNFSKGQEKPAFHITTIQIAPKDNDNYKNQLRLLIDVFETEQLGLEAMIGTYRTGNKWTFVSLRPNSTLFGKEESELLKMMKDSSSVNTYQKASETINQMALNVNRKVIQQINEWSYAPQGIPEHDQFAIVQEWNLKPNKKNFDSLMQDIVTWAKETEYPYVFDTYYTVEQPWRITFVTWVNSLDSYFQNYTIGALENPSEKINKLQKRLNTMLIDFKVEVNIMMPEYSYFPQQ